MQAEQAVNPFDECMIQNAQTELERFPEGRQINC